MASCGCYFLVPHPSHPSVLTRRNLPLVSLRSHTTVVSSTSRTSLTQTFVNPQQDSPIDELRYAFPLYDGVSVVSFVCTINNDHVIRGRVKEKDAARRAYKDAVARGETAGLLEQQPDAADVFTTTIGNVPAAAEVRVEVTYLGELKHDAQEDGMRFTIPTTIAPRYGSSLSHGDQPLPLPAGMSPAGGIEIVIDVEVPVANGNYIKTIKSPSHPISVEMKAAGAGGMSAATAELSISSLELAKDVVVIIAAAKPEAPVAVLELHPSIANQRALMATFVPRFNLPQSRPEIVFVCDRSGSMGTGKRIPNLKAALHVFLRSLPVGTKFNIVSFGSTYSFLFDRSQSYSQSSLEKASQHVDTFDAGYGGTEMQAPIEEVFKRGYADMDLEIFVITDGEVWNQNQLFDMVNRKIAQSHGTARLFTLGLGNDVSTSLVEGLARAGRGFAQIVGDDEKLNSKVVRMLKAALSPHINDCSLEIQYEADAPSAGESGESDEGFEVVEAEHCDNDAVAIEKVLDALTLDMPGDESSDSDKGKAEKSPAAEAPASDKKPISLFDSDIDPDQETTLQGQDGSADAGEPKYAHVPAVPVPKFLQAPFEIPPMYNFSRASIYVLLGPSSPQRTPKALVLRGETLSHGPVELSIPVQALPRPGETVHQLAAKKAVQDLEEGRGWLAHAKDAVDGKLLKEKHEGRFGDMVEREAVRLGVEFQVGGKWCSFVAVDEQKDGAETATAAREQPQPPIYKTARAPPPPPSPPSSMRTSGAQSFCMKTSSSLSRRSADSSSYQAAVAFGGPSTGPSPSMGGLFGSRPSPSASLSGVARPAAFSFGAPPAASLFGAQTQSCSDELFGVAPAPSTSGGLFGQKRYDATSSSTSQPAGSLFGAPAPPAGPSGPPMAFACAAAPTRRAAGGFGVQPSEEDSTPSDPLSIIVKAQAFEGFWDWSPALYAAIGLAERAVAKELPADVAGGTVGATACVVAFLRKKLADSADEWELLVEKAVGWLEGQGAAVEALLAAAEALF